MARRRKVEFDELVPEEVIETTEHHTVSELMNILDELETQFKKTVEDYEKRIKDLTNRIEMLEEDFKEVVDAITKSKGGAVSTPSSTPMGTPSIPTGPSSGPSGGPSRGPSGGPSGGPAIPKL